MFAHLLNHASFYISDIELLDSDLNNWESIWILAKIRKLLNNIVVYCQEVRLYVGCFDKFN
jgi:hypothetical protein